MPTPREIVKIGLAAIVNDQLLVVRKRGSMTFILPGGKPEQGEEALQTLTREIEEELGCSVVDPKYLASFSDRAADAAHTSVTVHLYAGLLCGDPLPGAEIEELGWVGLHEPIERVLAPSIVNYILPYLRGSDGQEPIRATG